jgi:predicted MFS family arabinose efflux permease
MKRRPTTSLGLAVVPQWLVGLQECPRELWIIYILKFLESLSYFSISLILVPFLSHSTGMLDLEAGIAYGLLGMCVSVYAVISGVLIDKFGIRRCLAGGSFLLCIARISLVFVNSKWALYPVLLTILPMGMSMGFPVM